MINDSHSFGKKLADLQVNKIITSTSIHYFKKFKFQLRTVTFQYVDILCRILSETTQK